MRLTLKITIAIFLGVTLLFSLHSYLTIQRERDQLMGRLSLDARHLGQSLKVMVRDIWRTGGEQTAIGFLSATNLPGAPRQARWVWLHVNTPQRFRPLLAWDKLAPLERGETLSSLLQSPDGQDLLVTYLPLKASDGRLGAIEIRESLEELHGYIQESLQRSILLLVAMVGSGFLLMAILGSVWINQPVRKLTEHARRIGAGDFSTSVVVSGHDELAALGSTIEQMRTQLAEARAAEQEATQAKFDALEKLRHTERLATLGRLSAGMAHEIGTPLNVISGRARMIADRELDLEEASRSAGIIGEQAERMATIMRQLLDFARRNEAHKQAVNVAGLIRGVVDLIAPTARKQGVTMQVEVADEALTVHADPGQLQQVLLNLAMNGVQAMPAGGELHLDAQLAAPPDDDQQHEMGCIRVRDQGGGIPAELMPQIFDPFFTTKEIGQGTGLGLSIVYGIVEEHGGRIEVESNPGEGTCFRVYLPLFEEESADA